MLDYDGLGTYDDDTYYSGIPSATRVGRRWFDLLPDYMREADRGDLELFVGAMGDAAAPVAAFIDSADPDTSSTGTCEPVNPATAPADWLGWIGWLVGASTEGLGTSAARWYLSRSGAQAHGSPGGIKAAVQATLEGSRFCEVQTHVGGNPWRTDVVVRPSEVADAGMTLRAARREKPAGVLVSVLASEPVTYADLRAAYGTYGDMRASGLSYQELRFTI